MGPSLLEQDVCLNYYADTISEASDGWGHSAPNPNQQTNMSQEMLNTPAIFRKKAKPQGRTRAYF